MEKFIERHYQEVMTYMYYAGYGRCVTYLQIQDFVLMNSELMGLLDQEGGK